MPAAVVVAVLPPKFSYDALDLFPRVPESKCADDCTEKLQKVIRQNLHLHVDRYLPQDLEKYSDGGIPPLNPNSPENSAALKKGSTREKNNIVPYTRKSSQRGRSSPPNPPSSSSHQTGPPSARDNWAADEPYHTPLKINWICVVSQRAQGFIQAAAESRCQYKPLPKMQHPLPVQPLAIPVPDTAPVLEPAMPFLAPAGAGSALLLKGV
ncbi:MAG: hypothetical protein M1826_006890 [Phylliscum demangeonii]|nr:MAG: hypothetical protein M1826_006890 [Phylliscum demangeonii]